MNFESAISPQEAEEGTEGEQIRKEFLGYVETLVQRQENFLGKGSLAEVHKLDANPEVCVKVINTSKKYGTISPYRINESPFYNTVKVEADFMSDLQAIRGEVGVPKPYYSLEQEVIDAGGDAAFISALAMETLDAVSIEEVLNGMAELPQAFDNASFWDKLEKFVEKMHERHIYHRDIHAGNIMIGKHDGKPYLIDFGTATYSTEADAYDVGLQRKGASSRPFIEDFIGLFNVRKRLVKEVLTNKI